MKLFYDDPSFHRKKLENSVDYNSIGGQNPQSLALSDPSQHNTDKRSYTISDLAARGSYPSGKS